MVSVSKGTPNNGVSMEPGGIKPKRSSAGQRNSYISNQNDSQRSIHSLSNNNG